MCVVVDIKNNKQKRRKYHKSCKDSLIRSPQHNVQGQYNEIS